MIKRIRVTLALQVEAGDSAETMCAQLSDVQQDAHLWPALEAAFGNALDCEADITVTHLVATPL
jgi:hypothetical protein